MNVNMNASVQGLAHGAPPKSENIANLMAKSVANGDVSIEQLQKNLSERLGVEDSSSIVAKDGGVDVEALTELLELNKANNAGGPSAAGSPSGRPPLSGGPGSPGGSDITQVLTNILGEDALAEVTEENGSYNVESLMTALQQHIEARNQSDTGNLIDLLA